MINGIHTIMYSRQPDDVRAFFRDVLDLRNVDAGGGWLIFALPPGELAVHPDDENSCELYLMCDDLTKTVAALKKKGVTFVRPVSKQPWGDLTAIRLPGGAEIGLYEPKHPLAITPARRPASTRAKRPKRRS